MRPGSRVALTFKSSVGHVESEDLGISVVVSLDNNPVADKVKISVFSVFRNNMELSVDVPSPFSVESTSLFRHVIGVDNIPFRVVFINLLVLSVDSSHFRISLTLSMSEPFSCSS